MTSHMQIFSVCVSGCLGLLAWKNQFASHLQVHATALQLCKCVTSISQLWLFTCACLDAQVCLLFVCFLFCFFSKFADLLINSIQFKLITHTHAQMHAHTHHTHIQTHTNTRICIYMYILVLSGDPKILV